MGGRSGEIGDDLGEVVDKYVNEDKIWLVEREIFGVLLDMEMEREEMS